MSTENEMKLKLEVFRNEKSVGEENMSIQDVTYFNSTQLDRIFNEFIENVRLRIKSVV